MTVRTQEEFNDFAATKLRSLDEQHKEMKTKLEENTKLTQEVVNILRMAKTFFTVVNGFGVLIKWTAGLVVAIFTLYRIWKGSWK